MDKIAPVLNVLEMTTRVITRVVKEVEENKREFPGKEKQIFALSIVQGFLKELGVSLPDEEILRYIDSVVGLYNALGLFSKKKVLSKEEWEKTIVTNKPEIYFGVDEEPGKGNFSVVEVKLQEKDFTPESIVMPEEE